MSNKLIYDITSLNVRELREQGKRGAFFRTSKIKNPNSIFYKKHILKWTMKLFGEMNGEVKYFSHGAKHSKGVCILIKPLVQEKNPLLF